MKRLWLFLLTCMLGGVLTFLGSVLGNAFGETGLYAGAIIGGVFAVVLAGWIGRGRLFAADAFGRVVLGGVVGFILAAWIATSNMHTPVIPLLSIGLIGMGAVIGSLVRRALQAGD
ncbi:MAG TPA: hypothetical protein VD948_07950 [Rhodothermales bacterium]|nr:hypothetical protein [Rhodothermales bacterium]